MNTEEFRELIIQNYKAAMQDCQIPCGALAALNPAEYYAFTLYEQNKRRTQEQGDSELLTRLNNYIDKEIESVTEEQKAHCESLMLFHEGELEALRRVKKWLRS